MLHQAIAAKLLEDPEPVLEKARLNLAQMVARNPGFEVRAAEWSTMLAMPARELAARLVGPGETMIELRAASPFAGVLSVEEVADISYEWSLQEGYAEHLAEQLKRTLLEALEILAALEDPVDGRARIRAIREQLDLER